ncbi:kynureninase [Aeromicrobium sp.]|uniref:kynureninase n=1 Tax=Aeromicrobium sp. TaxID=1871063 RepID=UPI003D6A8CA3
MSDAELRTRAASLDAEDSLAGFRERFLPADGLVAYFDGNSLGRPPRATAERLASFVTGEWGGRLIRGWDEGWVELPVTVGDELAAAVLGAAPGQTVVADSTSVNLFKVLHAACRLRPDRYEIVIDTTNFPTDRYLVEGVAEQRGMTVRWIEPDLVENVTAAALAEVLGERTAAVVLSHVDYRSGTILDVAGLTQQVHASGGLIVWDLCHSAGVLPIALDAADVDFAVGCTYKYLNAGPGAPAFLYVAARHLSEAAQPVPGWFSAADLFAMSGTYTAAPDIRRMLSGTPNLMGILAVREGAKMVAEAGLEAIRAKSILLTEFLLEQVDRLDVAMLSPRSSERRGSHVTIQVPDAAGVAGRLGAAGVIPDVRHPDLLRLGLSPLSTSFTEVHEGWAVLADILGPPH